MGQQLYLQVFSTIDGNENFCEAVAFTYLDFPEGILGLAYLPPNGICGSRVSIWLPFCDIYFMLFYIRFICFCFVLGLWLGGWLCMRRSVNMSSSTLPVPVVVWVP